MQQLSGITVLIFDISLSSRVNVSWEGFHTHRLRLGSQWPATDSVTV